MMDEFWFGNRRSGRRNRSGDQPERRAWNNQPVLRGSFGDRLLWELALNPLVRAGRLFPPMLILTGVILLALMGWGWSIAGIYVAHWVHLDPPSGQAHGTATECAGRSPRTLMV